MNEESAEFQCSECGSPVQEADRVCGKCGADLEETILDEEAKVAESKTSVRVNAEIERI
jgi:transcription initiation factor IIE alpha subunit